MSGDRKPSPDDRVKVTFEADYWSVQQAQWFGKPLVDVASVEVLESADDPSKDLIGTLRREERHGGFALYVHGGSDSGGTAWVVIHSSEPGILGDRMDHSFVAEFPVIGTVPGTPAAEQERERHMHNAGYCGACNMVHDRREYVPPLPEVIDAKMRRELLT